MSEATCDYTVVCVSEALAPITHMAGSSGNEAMIAREPVVTPRGIRMVPHLSGNALRHRCIRAPGMDWLVEEYGLNGALTLPELNFLYHGGALTEGGGREDTRKIAEMQRLWPLLRLLGGCLPDQILAGSLQVWRGLLICEENRATLTALLPDPCVLPERLRSAESFVVGYLYTRSDARKTHAAMASEEARTVDSDARDAEGKKPKGNQIPFVGQLVMRGSVFIHGFTLPRTSLIELGALLWSLRLWSAAGGTVGGQASRGHGRLGLSVLTGDYDADVAVQAYLDHARAARVEAVDWLHRAFAKRADTKPAKGKGGNGKTTVSADPVDADGLFEREE